MFSPQQIRRGQMEVNIILIVLKPSDLDNHVSNSSDTKKYYIRAKRSLIPGQEIPDLAGIRTIVGAKIGVNPDSRRTNALRFKHCAADTDRPGCVAQVCGPLALLNGACADHANCRSKSFDVIQVLDPKMINKGEELTLCYDFAGAVEVQGISAAGVKCGYKKCTTKILK